MISRKEREEVAKKLRENSTTHTTDEVYVALLSCIGITYDYANLLNRLADLIDPTCEVVEVPDNDEFMVRVVSGFMCKKCGHEAIVERSCDGWAEPPKYCPNCGVRLVRDDG